MGWVRSERGEWIDEHGGKKIILGETGGGETSGRLLGVGENPESVAKGKGEGRGDGGEY